MTDPCPTCGARRRTSVTTSLRRRLEALGPEWTVVRIGASRAYVHKLRGAYPDHEWRATRTTLLGGAAGRWTIEARTPLKGGT